MGPWYTPPFLSEQADARSLRHQRRLVLHPRQNKHDADATNAPATPSTPPMSMPMGEVHTRCAASNSGACRGSHEHATPWYWIIRDVLPRSRAIKDYGIALADADQSQGDSSTEIGVRSANRLGYLLPKRTNFTATKSWSTVTQSIATKSEYLPNA